MSTYVPTRPGSLKTRAASGLLLAGTIYLFTQVHRSPECFSQRTSLWYYESLLPGVMLFLLGAPVYPYWLPLVVLIAAEWNHRALKIHA